MPERNFNFQPIGTIETDFPEKFGTPRQGSLVRSSLGKIILKKIDPATLDGLSGFSHLWLIFVFDQNSNKRVNSKVRLPRAGGKKLGVFATRTPHRPNPIGLTLVELISINRNEIHVKGVDLIGGTSILDIKPYIPSDRPRSSTQGWIDKDDLVSKKIVWKREASQSLKSSDVKETARIRKLVAEVLKEDPRPSHQRGPKWDHKVFGLSINRFNIKFRISSSKTEIIEVYLR